MQGALGRLQPQAGHLGKKSQDLAHGRKAVHWEGIPLVYIVASPRARICRNVCFDRAVYCFYIVESTRKMW